MHLFATVPYSCNYLFQSIISMTKKRIKLKKLKLNQNKKQRYYFRQSKLNHGKKKLLLQTILAVDTCRYMF